MLEPMLAALNYLHTSGYAHGHLTPSNIMAVGDQLKLASDSIQRFGESREASAEGDVWSLGMTLVEVLTRQKPDFEEGRYEEPLLPEMPAPFLEIARRSLHRDPQQRLTIDQIATLLREPVRASRPAVAAKSRVASVRFALGGLVLLAFVAAIVYARWIKKDETVASAPPAAPQVAAEPRSTPSTAVPIKPEPRAEKPVNAKPIEAKPVEAPKHEPTVAAADPKEEPDTNAVDAGPLPAGIVKQVVPEVTRKARATIHGKVKTSIKVSVDAAGNVSGASIDSQGSSLYFAGLALGAVRKWQFASAEGAGTQEWIINFEFTREKTRINPVRVGR
jgi:hypothetical protein